MWLSENCKLIWNDCRSASMPHGARGTGRRVLVEVRASGQMRRVTKISNPLL